MALNLVYISVFGLAWGGVILMAYRTGVADGREFGLEEHGDFCYGESPWAEDTPWDGQELYEHYKEKESGGKVYDFRKDGGSEKAEEEKPKATNKMNTILHNIDNYNGSPIGQKEV